VSQGVDGEQILIVDDEAPVRELLCAQLSYLGHPCLTAADAEEALRVATVEPRPALVLSDVEMPGASGVELLQRLKQLDENLPVVMVSGLDDIEVVRRCLRAGAYDYIVKPFELEDLANTVRRALERGRLIRQNEAYRLDLERMVAEQTEEIGQTRDIAILTLAKLAESRDNETGLHLERMAAFSRRLAEVLAGQGRHREVTAEFVEHLHKSSPLHDIGKVGIPDAILLKPGPLNPEEAAIMRTHTTIGGDTLRQVLERFSGRTFLAMGMEIAYSHHERWDGKGYPAGLAGGDIPLPARIVALADAYDAITSDRPYKRAFDHLEAIRRLTIDRGKHFDPVVVDAFLRCADDFAAIYRQLRDRALEGAGLPVGPPAP
jgi:putative two-component system response regulator